MRISTSSVRSNNLRLTIRAKLRKAALGWMTSVTRLTLLAMRFIDSLLLDSGKLVKADYNPVFTPQDDEFDEDDALYGIQLNDVAVVLIHRALKAYYENWPGGDPWEQAEIKTLKDYFFKLSLEVTLEFDGQTEV